jgi:hypothetical protein
VNGGVLRESKSGILGEMLGGVLCGSNIFRKKLKQVINEEG